VTFDSDWKPKQAPAANDMFKITPLPGGGTVAEFDHASPKNITLTFDGTAPPLAGPPQGATLTIVGGLGKGLAGSITTYTPGKSPSVVMDTNWKPTPASGSSFEIVKLTTYTIKELPSRFDVYADSHDPALLIADRPALLIA
jgi:hypothetical protein